MNDNEFLKYSRITGRKYNVFDTIRILNLSQGMAYIDNGVLPVDITVSRNKNGNRCLVFYFIKDDTVEVYDKWCKYEL